MTKELQDLAWSVLPKEFKEEVKRHFFKKNAQSPFSIECDVLCKYFGPHNLTSDAEGDDDETLYVSRKKLQYFYENLRRVGENHAAFALQSLFGSKCMPDENSSNVEKLDKNDEDYNVDSSEQKAAGPKYGSDDKVTLNGCGGFVITSSYLDPYTREYKYRLGGFKGHFCESDLEPYTEPEGKLGMDARGWFRIDTDAIGNKIKVRIPSGVTGPYTEPEDEVAKMKPIESKVSVYLATKEEDEELRLLLHKNGFKWETGTSLINTTYYDPKIESTTIYYIYPDKSVTYYGRRTSDALTLAEFEQKYFGENVNLSQKTANCDKCPKSVQKTHPDFGHSRLHIAAMAMQGLLSNTTRFSSYEISDLVRISLNCADALIKEAKKGVSNEN